MQPLHQSSPAVAAVRASDRRVLSAESAAQFITFTLGAAEYGLDIMAVREIKGWTDTTTIPNAPDYVRGVINLRGVIVPIFDLRARFGMGLTEPTSMHVVVIVIAGARTMGMLVDAVSDIISVEPGAVRPIPEMGLPSDDCYLDGLVPRDGGMVTLVSLEGLFGLDRARVPDSSPRLAIVGAEAEPG